MKKVMLRSFLIFIVLVFSISYVFSDEPYFGDFFIEVGPTGAINIEADTNYHNFQQVVGSHDFTFKERDVWTLNISTEEKFDYYIYEIVMPKGTEIIFMNDRSSAKIFDRDKIIILGDGLDENIDIYVKYRIDSSQTYANKLNASFIAFGILIAFLTFFLFFYVRKRIFVRSREGHESSVLKDKVINKNPQDIKREFKVDVSIYPQRQQDILNMLLENGKMSQKDIENKMEIPSSSVSRNIQSLISRKILIKERIGQANYISINEEVLK